MKVSLVVKFRNKYKYTHQLMFIQWEEVKESGELKSLQGHTGERMLKRRNKSNSEIDDTWC
jgi:hypothetical protein